MFWFRILVEWENYGSNLGVCVGVIAATFVCPLDVIKTRFQVHGLPNLEGSRVKGENLALFYFFWFFFGHQFRDCFLPPFFREAI